MDFSGFIKSLLYSLLVFLSPVGPFCILLFMMVSLEYFMKINMRKLKEPEIFSLREMLVKFVIFSWIILIGLVLDGAFGLQQSNFPVLINMGLNKKLSPLATLLSIALVAHQGKYLDAIWKKKYGKGLLEQFTNAIPQMLEFMNRYKNK